MKSQNRYRIGSISAMLEQNGRDFANMVFELHVKGVRSPPPRGVSSQQIDPYYILFELVTSELPVGSSLYRSSVSASCVGSL